MTSNKTLNHGKNLGHPNTNCFHFFVGRRSGGVIPGMPVNYFARLQSILCEVFCSWATIFRSIAGVFDSFC